MPESADISFELQSELTGHSGAVYALCASPGAGKLISVGSDGIVAEWDPQTGDATAIARADGAIFSVLAVPEHELIVIGQQSGHILFIDYRGKRVIKSVAVHKKAVFELILSPDRKTLLSSGQEGLIVLWDLESMAQRHAVRISDRIVRTLAFSPDGSLLAAGCSDSMIRLFDPVLNPVAEWKAHAPSVFRVLFHPDGGTLYSTGRDAHIRAYALSPSIREIKAVPAHNYAVNDLIFHPNGTHLLSGSMDKQIRLWDAGSLELCKVAAAEKGAGHLNGINRLRFLDEVLYSCGDDRRILTWRIRGI